MDEVTTELATRTAEVLAFGPFTLVPDQRLLTKEGVRVDLGGRALDLLLQLVARPGQPIGKQALLDAVWPDQTVGEGSLRFHMTNLRKALGDGQRGARYVETLSGRGYSFVAPVTSPRRGSRPGATNLPLRPQLIGRETELAEVAALFRRERLVTIVGPGGVGKTRLAIESGRRCAGAYADGVWLVDLASVSDPSLVVNAVAAALDLARGTTHISARLIAAALMDRRLLLVLDNCEHLIGAVASLAAALLAAVPELTILATSQESLRIEFERVYRLGPLALPPEDAAEVEGFGAVDLFIQRVVAADGRFALDDTNGPLVADVRRRLDGVPLSIEMAAARVPALGLWALRASLDARLQVLSTGLRTSEPRQQTLRSTVDWSVGLLDDAMQGVFRRLGVFPGEFTLDAALAAAGQAGAWSVADAIAHLVDRSLVVFDGVQARYRLLETLRLYARETLQTSGEWDAVAERHARHFCGFFAPAQAAWESRAYPDWRATYLPEMGNLRSALEWALDDSARSAIAIELAAAAGHAWQDLGLLEEGLRLTDRVLPLLDDRAPRAHAAAVLEYAGRLRNLVLMGQGAEPSNAEAAYREGAALLERSAAILRESGDEAGLARVSVHIASLPHIRTRQGSSDAVELGEGLRETLLAGNHLRTLASLEARLMNNAYARENWVEAADHVRSLASIFATLKDPRLNYLGANYAALSAFSLGDGERAIEHAREALRLVRELPFWPGGVLGALHNLAAYLLAADRVAEARPFAEEALTIPDPAGRVPGLQMWALIGALEGRHAEAARLIAWVDAAYERSGERRNAWERRSYERLQALLNERFLGAERRADAGVAGWQMTDAVNFALDLIVHPSSAARV